MESQNTEGIPECGKNTELSPEKSVKTLGKQSYTRSYPQYAQKKSTSVVREKSCQVRKFVLGFVIKSQKKGRKEIACRKTVFLDNWVQFINLPVNA